MSSASRSKVLLDTQATQTVIDPNVNPFAMEVEQKSVQSTSQEKKTVKAQKSKAIDTQQTATKEENKTKIKTRRDAVF